MGVIRDLKSNGINAAVPDEIYFPLRQLGQPAMTIVVRTNGNPDALQSVIRSAVAAVDKDQPISLFASLQTTVTQSLGTQEAASSLMGIFAGLALALAAAGLYAVVAYAVSQRTAEIGIRMALGASPTQVIGLVMKGGLGLVAIGMLIGLGGAATMSLQMETLLFEVQPLDPRIYCGVTALFVIVAILACLLPSIRAAKVDPQSAFHA